jgi:hypothetical protein
MGIRGTWGHISTLCRNRLASFGHLMWRGNPEEAKKPVPHWFHFPLQIIAAGFVAYWHWKLPLPNKAVLCLAAIAALMVLAEMRPIHKALYVVLILALVMTENRAINDDREKFEKDRAKAEIEEVCRRKQENNRFETIANGLALAYQQSQAQFSATMSGLNLNMKEMTGGDSFCYIDQRSFEMAAEPLRVVHRGGYPLYNLSIQILDRWQFDQNLKMEAFSGRDSFFKAQITRSLGTMIPGSFTEIPKPAPTAAAIDNFQITFTALNGFWQQQISLVRLENKRLVMATKVWRITPGKPTISQPNKVLFEEADKDFPRDKNGGVDWNYYAEHHN